MTLIEEIKKGKVPPVLKQVAKDEGMAVEDLMRGVAEGKVVVPANRGRKLKKPCGIGAGLRVKVNANIGTSPEAADHKVELKKLAVAAS